MSRLAALAALAVLAGCLPSSQKQNSRAVSPADSASTALAATVPVDSLTLAWSAAAPADDPMPVPSSMAWLGDALAVVETQEGSIRRFRDGAYLDRTDLEAESFPYAAGARGDSLVVLARGRNEIQWVVPGEGVARRVPAPASANAALAMGGGVYVRVGGGPDTLAPAVLRLDASGLEVARVALPGAAWRSVGFLRAWGDSILALSGYRPVVDVVRGGRVLEVDTLALVGFASPQLPRSAQFQRGEVTEPPLLSSSAAAVGDRLFVLNLRTDHVRVDVYGRDGRLERVLASRRVRGPETVFALDVAVRAVGDGGLEVAVLFSRPPGLMRSPDSRVDVYRWRAGGLEDVR